MQSKDITLTKIITPK